MDDAVNFPIIYLVNDSSYFILPYQMNFLALQQPNLFTDFILVPGPQTLVMSKIAFCHTGPNWLKQRCQDFRRFYVTLPALATP